MEAMLVFVGWMLGVLTCLLYVSVQGYLRVTRRNRHVQELLDSGMDVADVIKAVGL